MNSSKTTRRGKTSLVASDCKLVFPPYGYVNSQFQWDVDTRRVPEGFTLGGLPATPRQWANFVDKLVDELAGFLWPRYNRRTSSWQGKSVDNMLPLTNADLDLMEALKARLVEPVTSDGRSLQRTHKSLFIDEDVGWPGSPPLPTLDAYLPTIPPELLASMKDVIRKKLGGLGPAQLRFKEEFQRPRPNQVAFMLNRPFAHEWAKSSLTPSMVSGHCLQALVTRTGAYMTYRLDLELVSGAVTGFQQYAADVGDRRVLAGVHYPSDNISSWFCALRLCDHMFGEAGQVAKNFMWSAIARSAVYDAIKLHVQGTVRSPFDIPMKLLLEEAQRPATRTDN